MLLLLVVWVLDDVGWRHWQQKSGLEGKQRWKG